MVDEPERPSNDQSVDGRSMDVSADVSTDVPMEAAALPKELLAQVQTGFSQEVVNKCGFLHSQTLCNKGWEGLSRLSAFSHWYADKDYAKLPCDESRPECEMFNFKEKLLNILNVPERPSNDQSVDGR